MEQVYGRIKDVKGIIHGDNVGAQVTLIIQAMHMPDDFIKWTGKAIILKKQEIVKRVETELERSARERRERDDARKYEALGTAPEKEPADIPQDKTDPETCEFCECGSPSEAVVDEWLCGHVDGKPEQPTGLEVWSCKNFTRRIRAVDAEDAVELCKGDNCTCFINLDPKDGTAAGCAWEETEISLAKDVGGAWLRHQACLELEVEQRKDQALANMAWKDSTFCECCGGTEGVRTDNPGMCITCMDKADAETLFCCDCGSKLEEDGSCLKCDNRACRVCGCTEDNPCEDPCFWLEYDLCSSCVGKEQPDETVTGQADSVSAPLFIEE